MKKLVLPQNREGYVPQGIYMLPKEERRSAFEKLLNSGEHKEIANYRISARKRMRGELQ